MTSVISKLKYVVAYAKIEDKFDKKLNDIPGFDYIYKYIYDNNLNDVIVEFALFDKEDSEFRITFDNQIHTKRNNVVFDQDDYEVNILDEGLYILEIKSVRNYPLWLVNKLSELKIYPHSFSKYGTEYKMYYINKKKEKQNA